MHPCLQIDEILIVIARAVATPATSHAVDSETHPSSNPSTLLHMALTCKTFYEPFTDELWRSLGDVKNLLYSFAPETVALDYYMSSEDDRNWDGGDPENSYSSRSVNAYKTELSTSSIQGYHDSPVWAWVLPRSSA